jgi:hypothetical protein
MDLIVPCPNCSRKLRIKDELAGKKLKCPACNTAFRHSADVTPTKAPPTYAVGGRVLAGWLDQYLYPATIKAVEPGGFRVLYDDGDQQIVPEARLRPIAVEVGQRIFIRPHQEQRLMYFPAIVRRVAGEIVDVEFEPYQGQAAYLEKDLPLGRARFPGAGPTAANQAAPAPAGSSLYAMGDRVLARWVDLYWYPATIINLDARGSTVLYDDGEQRTVTDAQLMPISVEEGERIFMRPRGETQLIYFPAVVTRVDGETVDVEFEASDAMEAHAETNLKVGRARFWRCPRGVTAGSWQEGDRVFALLDEAYWYPAEIVSLEEDRLGLQVLSGGDVFVTPELIRQIDIKPGARVECRWQGAEDYYPGIIARLLGGDKIQLAYDDGATEMTVIRLIRVPRETV